MSRSLWLALVIGCGHPAAAVAPPGGGTTATVADASVDGESRPLDEDLPRLADRAVKLYQDWQRAFSDVGTDCTAATARMNALADANADVIAANGNVLHAGRDRMKAMRAEMEKRKDLIDPAAKAVMDAPVMTSCASQPEFARAVDRLAGGG